MPKKTKNLLQRFTELVCPNSLQNVVKSSRKKNLRPTYATESKKKCQKYICFKYHVLETDHKQTI